MSRALFMAGTMLAAAMPGAAWAEMTSGAESETADAGVQTMTGGIRIQEKARAGNVISARLLEMGTQIADGALRTPAAIAEARRLIREATGTN